MVKNNNKKSEIEKMDGRSKDIWSERLKKLQQEFPEVLSENRIDCDQLKKLVGDENIANGERYQFSWAGKSASFQEIKKRTTATLKSDKKESVEFDKTKNLFIEGENLEALKILQKTYYGEVKMIYIDPPYNTGNDFIYNDKFAETREEYEEKTGDVDEEGKKLRAFRKNTKESGHYHSNWLSMMYPRLYLARNLLREDGVIFVSIDDNELHNLRMIMNEIFGEENFVSEMVWRRTDNQPNIGDVARVKEYILCFARDINNFSFNKMKLTRRARKEYRYEDDRGRFRRANLLDKTRGRFSYQVETPGGEILEGPWMLEKKEFNELRKDDRIYWPSGGKKTPYGKIYLEDQKGQIPSDFLTKEFGTNQQAAAEMKKIFDFRVYDFPKPVSLMKHFISIGSDSKDIILDFFAGSATTAHAVMDLNAEDGGNRKYIMVQLSEETNEDTEARKAGYETIADIAKERIRRAGKKIKQDNKDKEGIKKLDIGFKVFKLSDSNFKTWVREEVKTEEELQQKLEGIVENVKEGTKKENMLFELMLKLGINPNANIEEKQGYYSIESGKYIICLTKKIDKNLVEQILEEEPHVVVCLDTAFKGNDELKTNTALQMKSKDIEFKVV